MSFRPVLASLPKRTVTPSTAIAAAQHSNFSRAEHVNCNAIHFATLNDSLLESPVQVKNSTPASFSSPWHVDVFTKACEDDKELHRLNKTYVLSEKHGKVACMWEPKEKGTWLERFGGPGKMMERTTGNERLVLRDAAPDGKSYLRILI